MALHISNTQFAATGNFTATVYANGGDLGDAELGLSCGIYASLDLLPDPTLYHQNGSGGLACSLSERIPSPVTLGTLVH